MYMFPRLRGGLLTCVDSVVVVAYSSYAVLRFGVQVNAIGTACWQLRTRTREGKRTLAGVIWRPTSRRQCARAFPRR